MRRLHPSFEDIERMKAIIKEARLHLEQGDQQISLRKALKAYDEGLDQAS